MTSLLSDTFLCFVPNNFSFQEKKPVLMDNCFSMVRASDSAEEAMAAACSAVESIAYECFLIGNDIPNWRKRKVCRM